MKPKSNRGKGRKRFSAGKLLSPEKSWQENLALAATGEFATNDQSRRLFELVACWHDDYAPLFDKPPSEKSAGATVMRKRRREHVVARLQAIIIKALDRDDPKAFEDIAKAIRFKQDLNRKGAVMGGCHEMLRVALEMNLRPGSEVQSASSKEFKSRLRWPVSDSDFNRFKKIFNFHFPSGRPKKAAN